MRSKGAFGSSACAEIDPVSPELGTVVQRLLRLRGDRPVILRFPGCPAEAPPPARRSTLLPLRKLVSPSGSSACAEIDPLTYDDKHLPKGLLRLRGDRPLIIGLGVGAVKAPPPARRSTRVYSDKLQG